MGKNRKLAAPAAPATSEHGDLVLFKPWTPGQYFRGSPRVTDEDDGVALDAAAVRATERDVDSSFARSGRAAYNSPVTHQEVPGRGSESIDDEREVLQLRQVVLIVRSAGQKVISLWRERPDRKTLAVDAAQIESFIRELTADGLDRLPVKGKAAIIAAEAADLVRLLSAWQGKAAKQAAVAATDATLLSELDKPGVLEAPTVAPVAYEGKATHGDPIAFLKLHYKPWLDAAAIDSGDINRLDPKLANALRSQKDQFGQPVSLKSIFPTRATPRMTQDAQGESWDLLRDHERAVQRMIRRRYPRKG